MIACLRGQPRRILGELGVQTDWQLEVGDDRNLWVELFAERPAEVGSWKVSSDILAPERNKHAHTKKGTTSTTK